MRLTCAAATAFCVAIGAEELGLLRLAGEEIA